MKWKGRGELEYEECLWNEIWKTGESRESHNSYNSIHHKNNGKAEGLSYLTFHLFAV